MFYVVGGTEWDGHSAAGLLIAPIATRGHYERSIEESVKLCPDCVAGLVKVYGEPGDDLWSLDYFCDGKN